MAVCTPVLAQKETPVRNHVEHVLAVQNELGECPLWSVEEQALYWVDIERSQVHRFKPASGDHAVIEAGFPMTAFGFCASGRWVTAAKNGLAFWHPHTLDYQFIADPEAGRPTSRLNDGAVDRQRRFWVGTLDEADYEAPISSLYRLDADASVHLLDSGFATTNGLGWSPDGQTLYFTDMFHHLIYAYDQDPASGALANRRVFARVPEDKGLPDGLTVDSEGCVWSCHWGGWQVTRYDPRGQVEREIRLPAQLVTRCAFGGEGLDELYVTTARVFISQEDLAKQPLAGDLFRVRTSIKGLPEPKFAG